MKRTLVLLAAALPLFSQDSREISRKFPLNADGRVIIDAQRGEVEITGADGAEVDVRVRIVDENPFLRDPDSVRDADVKFDSAPHVLRIHNDYSKIQRGVFFNFSSLPRIYYQIRMPRTASLRIESSRADVKIRDMKCDVEIDASRGDVNISRLDGSARVKVTRGNADVAFVQMTRRSEIEAYRGEAYVRLPRDKGFTVDTDIDRRSRLDSDFAIPMRVVGRRDREYRGPVNGGGPALILKGQRATILLRRG